MQKIIDIDRKIRAFVLKKDPKLKGESIFEQSEKEKKSEFKVKTYTNDLGALCLLQLLLHVRLREELLRSWRGKVPFRA